MSMYLQTAWTPSENGFGLEGAPLEILGGQLSTTTTSFLMCLDSVPWHSPIAVPGSAIRLLSRL